jgi:hypothetical protein
MSAASDNQIRLERSPMEAPEVRRSVEEPAQALYEASDPDGVPWNKRDLAIRELFGGESVRSQDHIRQGLALYDPDKHRHHALMYGATPELRVERAELCPPHMGSARRSRLCWHYGAGRR